MPRVTIELFEGRTLEQKRAIVKGVTEVLVKEAKVAPEAVSILLQEMSADNYSISGVLRCDQ